MTESYLIFITKFKNLALVETLYLSRETNQKNKEKLSPDLMRKFAYLNNHIYLDYPDMFNCKLPNNYQIN